MDFGKNAMFDIIRFESGNTIIKNLKVYSIHNIKIAINESGIGLDLRYRMWNTFLATDTFRKLIESIKDRSLEHELSIYDSPLVSRVEEAIDIETIVIRDKEGTVVFEFHNFRSMDYREPDRYRQILVTHPYGINAADIFRKMGITIDWHTASSDLSGGRFISFPKGVPHLTLTSSRVEKGKYPMFTCGAKTFETFIKILTEGLSEVVFPKEYLITYPYNSKYSRYLVSTKD